MMFLKRTIKGTITSLSFSVALIAMPAYAADIYLKAQPFDKTVGNAEIASMWGFAQCTDATFTDCALPSATNSPGPTINIYNNENLNITLQNSLNVPVSLIIPGQQGAGDPVMMTDGLGRSRVRSFTTETAANATRTYSWSQLNSGTYMYQSGTFQSLQVPMGLYGALIVHDGASYSSTILSDAPTHFYRMSEISTGVEADLGSTPVNATIGGGVLSSQLGYLSDNAAAFDPNDNSSFVNTNVTTLSTSGFSVEAWANANTLSNDARIISKELSGQGQFELGIENNVLKFKVLSSSQTWVSADSPSLPNAGATFHVAGVFDGNDIILYLDGIEVARSSLGTPTTATSQDAIFVGSDSNLNAPSEIFDGLIDEVSIYDAPLSAAQIQSHFDSNAAESLAFFSEIDLLQNQRVNAAANANASFLTCVPLADYAQTSTVGYPCTIDYNPLVLLVNGAENSTFRLGNPGGQAKIRFANAGLRSHTPSLVGVELDLVAEDGNPYPGSARKQSSALLPAGKTLDALVSLPEFEADGVTVANGAASLFDRMPSFTLPKEAALATFNIGLGSSPDPIQTTFAVDDNYQVTEDVAYSSGSSVLANDTGLTGATVTIASETSNGNVTLASDGTFSYTPNANFSGDDSFSYIAELNGESYPATVFLSVSFVNDAPTAAGDSFSNRKGNLLTINAPGVLANDADIDGDTLTAQIEGTAPAGLVFNADGSFSYSGPSTSFSYRAVDTNNLQSDAVTVNLSVPTPSNITLSVTDENGLSVTDYRWVVEENTMWQHDPSSGPNQPSLGSNFHKSYMPVFAQGSGAAEFADLALDPAKHYYVSVLPSDAATGTGHTIGGAQLAPGQTSVNIVSNSQPLPYAQISVYVFEDNSPTNGAVDGVELNAGLGSFQITLEDAGGRYGASAGTMGQDADGNPLTNSLDCFGGNAPPVGVILSCPDTPENRAAGIVGEALIKNLFPGKYGISVTPPLDSGTWTQTSTIEGTKVIDAWVKANEPEQFQEFGPGGWHVFVGFVNPDNLVLPAGGTNTVTGKVTNMHLSRPPSQVLVDSGSYDALAHTRAWVGLNSAGGNGANVAAVQANEDGTFEIPNVPDGLYQLVVWDTYLDQVIAYKGVALPDSPNVGNMPVFQWFTRSEHNVFLDENQNGIKDAGEAPISEQAVNIRWRDGTLYQSFPTDLEGFVPFDQTFPFFNWQVMEVDFTRFKATGLTVTVDNGGDVSTGPYPGVMAPQQQGPCTQDDVDNGWNGCSIVGAPYANPDQRTETGPVLTQGFQGFLGQTSVFDWGKAPYAAGENGGISGIVYYASTRAENDPRVAAAEPWEPGGPSVTVRLYKEVQTANGGTSLALIDETQTDNWDESLPTGCPGADPSDLAFIGGPIDKCYDGLRNFNQARPAVFDGGYAFMDIPPGKYVVEVVPPEGYELLKEEDNNVAYGDVFANVPATQVLANGVSLFSLIPDPATVVAANTAEPGLAQPRCVGVDREIPAFLSLFPSEQAEAPFAGAIRPMCDRKEVMLSDQGQAAADFFLFTGTPVAGHFAGVVLDDVAQEFDVNSPQFGEKWAPPFVPVSLRDYRGVEVTRVYTDQWGRMNGLVPSTFTANMPSPSGFSPAMLISCMNDPGPIVDNRADSPTFGESIVDPQYNPAYSNYCYTFQYMPGTTTYLDTPVLPVSAFASGDNPVDCALDEGTPKIRQVNGTGAGPLVAPNGTITIISEGNSVNVPNPGYEGPFGTGIAGSKSITRDFGFGASQGNGTVTLDGVELTVLNWDSDSIQVTAPAVESVGQLVVTRDNGNTSESAITLTVSNETPTRVANGGSIQDAIDAANPGDLILVEPGHYEELVIMWKPVRLQGAGAGSTIINAVKRPTEIINSWKAKMDCLYGIGTGCTDRVDGLPGQLDGAAGFTTEEGPGITVVGVFDDPNLPSPANSFNQNVSRIDGFSFTGGDAGGGIFVNSNAHGLEISNNSVFGNNGLYGGGLRVGRPYLKLEDDGPYGFNQSLNMHHNLITQNGGLDGAGGGVSIHSGTDNYTLSNNFVCGNFTQGQGAGIGHSGLSDNGVISDNVVKFNQSFSQVTSRSGGGILVAGEEPVVDGLSKGSGSVTIEGNLIQGNQAGAGHGGGIRTQFVNGQDIVNSIRARDSRARVRRWHEIRIENNMVINNVAGWSGGGISLQDTARAFVVNNTVVHNDSTATVAATFTTGNPNISASQPAGLSTEAHTSALNAVILSASNGDSFMNRYSNFSNPIINNNIIWENRSFYYDGTLATGAGLVPNLAQASTGECPDGAVFNDIGVLSGGFALNPRSSILTDATGYHRSNIAANPNLVNSYCNGGRVTLSTPGPIAALPAVDEAGATWIDVRYGPITSTDPVSGSAWDYHILNTSVAIDAGRSNQAPISDYDNDTRPSGAGYDIGADEISIGNGVGGIVTYTEGAFGTVAINDSVTIDVTATVSVAPVTFTSSSVPSLPFAKVADTCSGQTIAVGQSCTFTLSYSPTVVGEHLDVLDIVNDNQVGNPQTVNLVGTATLPPGTVAFLSSSPYALDNNNTRLNFGNLENGIHESTVQITIVDYPVTFGDLTISGNRYRISSEDNGDTCSGAYLTAGETCSVTIMFNANGNQVRNGRLNVMSNATNSQARLRLRGR